MTMTDTLDAIAREMQRTIDQHIFGSNDEVDAYLRGIVRKLYALSNQGEGAFGWYTEDYMTDRSATTYDCIVAERWRMKGWPVWNLYTSPKEAEADRRDAERWRALVGSARVRVLGSAGLRSDIDPNGRTYDGYAHIGLELWTKHEAGNSPNDAADWLTKYADIAATQEQT